MGNYEYMMAKCREFRSKQWDEEELRKCIGMLKSLTREELLKVYHCRFLDEKHSLRIAAFKMLFADKIGKREERIHTMPVEELAMWLWLARKCAIDTNETKEKKSIRLPLPSITPPRATNNGSSRKREKKNMNACMASHILNGDRCIITDKLYKDCEIKKLLQ